MKNKILIVDHKERSKAELVAVLTKEYEVIKANDAYQALDALAGDPEIKVVLLELLLPGMSGLELLQKIRSNSLYKELIVIIVTEIGNTNEEITALGIGADDYICQPISPEVVSARIRHILNNKELLRNSECRFSLQRNLLDATATAIFVVDAINHNLLYANNASKTLLKVKNDSYAGRKCYEYFFNKKYPCEKCKLFIAHTNENKSEVYIPKVTKTMNIRIHLMEWLTRPAYVVYMTDITEEKHARELAEERYQKELRRRYRVDMDFMAYLVINVTKGTVIEHDPHGFPVPTIYPGQPETEFIERVLPTVIDYEKRKEFSDMLRVENLRQAFAEGKNVLSIDYRRYSRNMKNIMWARSTIQLMEDPQSKDLIAFLYTYDINENKMMQEVISRAVNYDYNMIAYINLFSQTAKLYTSNGFGIDRLPKQEFDYQSAVEKYVNDFVPKKDREEILQKMSLNNVRQQLQHQDSYEFDITLISANGEKKVSRLRYVNLDKVYGMVLWTDRDITHIVNQAQQKHELLFEQIDGLKNLNRVKSEYLAAFGTSVRMPLKNILGTLKKMGNTTADDRTREELYSIKCQLSKISDIINDIMDISNLENERVKFSEVQFTISDFVATVSKDVRKKYAAKMINLECLEQVFHDSCLGDFKAAYKLLYNVLDNAYKYSDNGSKVQFIVYELPFKDQKEAIYRFVVKDWGCGIEEQRLATVFTPFYSFINQSDHKDSSGLGLSIAKFIVDRLGGIISIDSKEGAGTTVTIDLHMAFANTTQVKEEVRVEEQLTVNHMRLLLVQKNPLELLVLRKLLESKGAKIDCTESVEAAAELMKKHDIGYYSFLIVDMDNILSQMRGEALKKLKLHPHRGRGSLFALCANVDLDEKKALVEAGVDEVLFKPLRLTSLLEIMGEHKK